MHSSAGYKLLCRSSRTTWIMSLMCSTYLLICLPGLLKLSKLPMTVYVPAYLFVWISCILKLKKLNYLALVVQTDHTMDFE